MGTIGLFNDDSSDSEIEEKSKINEKHINERKIVKTFKHKVVNKRHFNTISKHTKHVRNKGFMNYSIILPINPIIKEIRKTQYTSGWKKLSNNIEKESWSEANHKIKEFENHNINIGTSIRKSFQEEIERTQKELKNLSLWSNTVREKETLKMKNNNDLMNKEIEECIKFKKEQVELIEKKKKEEQERKLKEEKERKEQELQRQRKLEQEKLEKENAIKLKKEQEAKLKEQQEQIKREEEKKKAAFNDTLNSFGDPQAIEEAQSYINEIKKIKNEIRPAVKGNKDWKNQTFKLKMKITTRVGQITNTRESVNEISNVLNDVLNQGKQISNEAYYWLMDFLGKAMMVC